LQSTSAKFGNSPQFWAKKMDCIIFLSDFVEPKRHVNKFSEEKKTNEPYLIQKNTPFNYSYVASRSLLKCSSISSVTKKKFFI
jgi:HD superfamily phosphohydrolase YqeK